MMTKQNKGTVLLDLHSIDRYPSWSMIIIFIKRKKERMIKNIARTRISGINNKIQMT
jgi:hypothetical protein